MTQVTSSTLISRMGVTAMRFEGCNASIIIRAAYYRLSASFEDMPLFVELFLKIAASRKRLILPLFQLSAAAIQKECPLLRFDHKKYATAFDVQLINTLMAGLRSNTIQRGYYLERAGAITFPDGHVCFLRGGELLGQCARPYLIAPDIGGMRLLGCGDYPLYILPLLLASPHSVLLTFSYVILASLRSLLTDNGIDLQAVLYIVGNQGLGKTTLATRIASIYERNGRPIGVVQAGSTLAAVNSLMTDLRDQPLIVDDLCLSASRDTARKRIDLASKLIRQGTGCIPITKKSGRSTVELPCESGLIFTAEFGLENLSDLTRCIIVPVRKQLSISNDLTPTLVGDAVRHYSTWFSKHFQEELQQFRDEVDDAVAFGGMDTRILTNYACLSAAFRSFIRSLGNENSHCDLAQVLLDKMNTALKKALREHQSMIEQIKESFPIGNLPFCLYEGYRNGAFTLAKKTKKLRKCDGILWKGDLCLRPDALVQFVRLQPGYHGWNRNKITRTLKDFNALAIQEDEAATVHLTKDSPRVYRIRLDVIKRAAQKYQGGTPHEI